MKDPPKPPEPPELPDELKKEESSESLEDHSKGQDEDPMPPEIVGAPA